MSNHFYNALSHWIPLKDECGWVLAAVTATRGPVYRKTGALMLLSDTGHQFGLLSGGCLESDLLLQARKVIALQRSRHITYDATDENSLAWRLGIGCGGAADIVLHPCHRGNEFLQLPCVHNLLKSNQACHYRLGIAEAWALCEPSKKNLTQRVAGDVVNNEPNNYLQTLINPRPHLLVMGSGVDLIPLCELAMTLGWQVTLADHRLTAQRRENFPHGVHFLLSRADDLEHELLAHIDGAIVAYHNLALDAAAMVPLQASSAGYIGLLGPAKRKQEALNIAGLSEAGLTRPVAGPMGLALGGDLPESIALSVLAECHAAIFGSSAHRLSDAYEVMDHAH